ncbi:pyruvate kinase [Ilumatobacter sp.]|uniref:pyruvate kinase n=1 Tax=Ilumatobacter sp. TaxID=1967498 RepID=UPI003B51C830
MTRRTKIVATIGPASDTIEMLRTLIGAGLDVVRLNLSHGDLEDHLDKLGRVRDAAEDAGRHVAVLADLPGPKIRSGHFPDGGVSLDGGTCVRLLPGDGPSDDSIIHVQYATLLEDLRPGSRVQLGDGAISMTVEEVTVDAAIARIETGGKVNGQPGVHLSSDMLRLETPTEEDLVLAEAVAAAGVEYIAVSFVRHAADVERVREVVGDRARLVAKIETRAALDDLDAIVSATDAVMVARGDLGIDCPIEDVPHLQKRIVRHCVELGKPVITATQMLESMVSAPSPTRAEVSDVANAVFDGTDAVMLSGETAIGRDPVGVVATMATIAERAESEASYRQWANRLGRAQRELSVEATPGNRITMALSHAASQAAMDAEVAAILCCTRSGRTARAMARFRPEARMVGLSPDLKMVRTMALTWGVEPMKVETYESTDEMVWFAVEKALAEGVVVHGDTVLVLAGAPGRDRTIVATDVLRMVRVD